MIKSLHSIKSLAIVCGINTLAGLAIAEESPCLFNRAPLISKPYAELPLGAIKAEGWLLDELQHMAAGMTGHLDEWYPQVCGDRNAWLGGDGDTWERGPYWIDGLYPLATILGDKALQAKAMRWIDWTLQNQREDGYIGPVKLKNRSQPPPSGAQIIRPDDWWPRMVMLKILQQHYMATGDPRVIDCLKKYFHYQLITLPGAPLHDPNNPKSGSWWAAQRGGDNLMVVLWLYNVTGEKYLLELADIIRQQTVPVTEWFSPGSNNMLRLRADQGATLHCVNLAQMMKTPVICWQLDRDQKHLDSIENAFRDIRTFHGQPNGLYGGDEHLHGDAPDRGSELCTAVEMMFSLEKIFEITGNPLHGDRLERVAFNALPTQTTRDYHGRQYFQQVNQVLVSEGDRSFFNDNGDRVVYNLLGGFPCCTCNLHQGWPKFTQHLWLATADQGIAMLAYAPSSVTTKVAHDQTVTLRQAGGYPFKETVTVAISAEKPAEFPLHVRTPAWTDGASITLNGAVIAHPKSGSMHIEKRVWKDGDKLELRFPMLVRTSDWFAKSKAIERGPLVFALDVAGEHQTVTYPALKAAPVMQQSGLEVHPTGRWNFALPKEVADHPEKHILVHIADTMPANPWSPESAPVRLTTQGVPLNDWTLNRNSAALPPLSPVKTVSGTQAEEITLIPYGSTILRITSFPWLGGNRNSL